MYESVELTAREMIQGAFVGLMRQVENLRRGRQDAHGANSVNGWQLHIEGALGEMAVAKVVDRYWSGAHGFRECDVGKYEVRTRSKHHYELIVHPDDADEARFILVTGGNGYYVLRGWILGDSAKREEWWKDPAGGRAASFVPQSGLNPIAEILATEGRGNGEAAISE